MGAEQSNSSRSGNTNRARLSKEEVDRLLQQQKALYEQKYAELLRIAKTQQQNSAAAQQTARDEARKEVERVMKEKQDQMLRQNAQLNAAPPKIGPQIPTSGSFERDRSPYTCAGPALTNATLAPSVVSPDRSSEPNTIYPNLNAADSTRHTAPLIGDANTCAQSVLVGRRHMNDPTVGTGILEGRRHMINKPPVNPNSPRDNNNMPPSATHGGQRSREDHSFEFIERPQSVLTPLPRAPSAPPRDRSISRSRNNANEDTELNCPTCKSRYSGNIYQCSRGHSSCSQCKLDARNCGAWVNRHIRVCNLPITEMRNITLEAYVGERKVLCPNSDEGCCLHIKLADMDAHFKECPFREMMCPLNAIFGQCSWKGKLSHMAKHFDNTHQMHRQANVDTEMILLNITNNNHVVYFVVMGTYNFLFHAKVSDRDEKIYMAVLLLGTNHSASKWSYDIHIYNKTQPRRKYQYADVCRSANTSIDELIANSECAALSFSYASTFMRDACLTYKFFIKKENDGRNQFRNNLRGRGGARRRV